MTIAIAGGSGTVGRALAATLAQQGRDVRVLSRHPRPVANSTLGEWAVIDYKSGAGLADALVGVDTVVFVIGGLRDAAAVARAAEMAAANTHLVYLSIVGIDDLPMRYYREKLAGERAVADSGKPWTVLRATQFHELVFAMMRGLARSPVMLVPRMSIQPVSSGEVAERLAELATAPPAGRAPDFGGPRPRSAAELAQEYLQATGRRRRLVSVAVPGALGRGLAAGANLAVEHRDGRETFSAFLRRGTADSGD